ncbi:MAG: D-TA family PLP-dependent enzyme [Ectothiorhodospiraceae bacterium]|nr:D-TA family PLP-dependent enzyme [Chromatiales bacterium]MCP5156379.1 D-TA family PLP-dependent enzyme [Ectothiorhodospiraceae bacterium]
MELRYRLEDSSDIVSPGLVIVREHVVENLRRMLRIAGNPTRLRPHCKTHKMSAITRIELAMGITKHKCATFAEAEMLAGAGVVDIVLAYNLVGPNIARAVRFRERFPDVRLAVTGDHPRPVAELGAAMHAAGTSIEVLLDVDTGQHRTGIPAGDAAVALYASIAETDGVEPGGLHVYDGQNHQADPAERARAVDAVWSSARGLRDGLVARGLPVPRIVAGGTGSFPIWARVDDPSIELSPGTCVLHDAGYAEMFPDLDFLPAALILTRVISLPGEGRVTVDLGYKACASDPPAGARLAFPELPDAREVLQNEEHLVLETEAARRLRPGDALLAVPVHACPTSALHKEAFVVEHGRLVERWPVEARDRWLTI